MAAFECLLGILGPFQGLAANLGILCAFYFVMKTLYFTVMNLYVHLFAEKLGKTVNFKEMGAWAVVTGASDGIGKGYALDLARRGCNIVLIARSQEKLSNVAKEIESKYAGVRTKIVVVDFTADESIYDKIKSELEGLEIGTLVNNVGVAYLYPEYFHKLPGGDKFALDMIKCNVIAQTLMTRIVLPQMVNRKKGVIISLSSGAGANPVPMMAEYSATKAYNDFLGRSLKYEYEDIGVIFQVIQPFVVATNMSGMKKTNLFILDAHKYARACLNTVGYFTQTNGHPSHAIQNWIATLFPAVVSGPVMKWGIMKFRDDAIARLKRKGQWKGE